MGTELFWNMFTSAVVYRVQGCTEIMQLFFPLKKSYFTFDPGPGLVVWDINVILTAVSIKTLYQGKSGQSELTPQNPRKGIMKIFFEKKNPNFSAIFTPKKTRYFDRVKK